MLIFNLEQTLEYNRLQVRRNFYIEIETQALMKIEHCFYYPNYNHKLCLWLLCLDNHPSYQIHYAIPNLLIQIPHQI